MTTMQRHHYTFTFNPDGTVGGWCAALRGSGLAVLPNEQAGCPVFTDGRTCSTCPAFTTPSCGSRYVVGSVAFQNLDDLMECIEAVMREHDPNSLGFSAERSADGENTLTANDYQGVGRDKEIGKCAAVIRRGCINSASNDLPIVKRDDGYHVVISDYDASAVPTRLGWSDLSGDRAGLEGRLTQHTALTQAVKKCSRLGYEVTEKGLNADGSIRLKVSHAGVAGPGSTRTGRKSRFSNFS